MNKIINFLRAFKPYTPPSHAPTKSSSQRPVSQPRVPTSQAKSSKSLKQRILQKYHKHSRDTIFKKAQKEYQKNNLLKADALKQGADSQNLRLENKAYYQGYLQLQKKGPMQDLDEAFIFLQLAAQNGNDEAQSLLANLIKGPPTDLPISQYFQKISTSTVSKDKHTLGVMYFERIAVLEKQKGLKLLEEAAEDYAPAQRDLAQIYCNQGEASYLTKASELLDKAAEQGPATEQLKLAMRYYEGKDIPKDLEKFHHFLELSAQKGSLVAQYNLAIAYKTGNGIARDDVKACQWFEKGVEQGSAEAQYSLAGMSFAGRGMKEDPAKSLDLLREAVAQGHARAQVTLGMMYAKGVDGLLVQDFVKARALYKKSLAQGNDEAPKCLEKLNTVEKEAKMAQALLVKEYHDLKKSAKSGNAGSQYNLGTLYALGRGCKMDQTKARACFSQAAKQGDNKAQYRLAEMYETGQGGKKRPEDASGLYQEVANHEDIIYSRNARYRVGEMFLKNANPENAAIALGYFDTAAQQGHTEAMNSAGKLLYASALKAREDNDFAKATTDFTKAANYFEEAAGEKNPWAQNKIGEAYEYGEGREKDLPTAHEWYEKAAQQGDREAENNLSNVQELLSRALNETDRS